MKKNNVRQCPACKGKGKIHNEASFILLLVLACVSIIIIFNFKMMDYWFYFLKNSGYIPAEFFIDLDAHDKTIDYQALLFIIISAIVWLIIVWKSIEYILIFHYRPISKFLDFLNQRRLWIVNTLNPNRKDAVDHRGNKVEYLFDTIFDFLTNLDLTCPKCDGKGEFESDEALRSVELEMELRKKKKTLKKAGLKNKVSATLIPKSRL